MVTLRKVGVELKWRRELNKRWGWRLAWWGSTEMKEASHFLRFRGRHQYSDQRFSQNRAPYVASIAVGTKGEEGPNGKIVSKKRAADGRRQRSRKIIDEKREKCTAKDGSLQNTSTDLKGVTLLILKNHATMPIRKERVSVMSKARSEAS